MNNLKRKVVSGLTAAATLVVAATPAFAGTSVEISGNGADSHNNVSVRHESRSSVRQTNNADIRNNVSVSSNTGNNQANKNTGGDVHISTGNSNTSVHVSNQANTNHIGSSSSNGNWNWNNSWHNMSGRKLSTVLTGGQEAPGPGDPNGWGKAKVKLHPSMGKICVSMRVYNIDTASAAHIHEAAVGVAGPVVLHLPTPNANGFASGCVDANNSLIQEIKNNPSDYYVNVHNTAYPNGAVRGQLH